MGLTHNLAGKQAAISSEDLLLYYSVKSNAQGTFKLSITVPNSFRYFLEYSDWTEVSAVLFLLRGTRGTGVLDPGGGPYQFEGSRPVSLLPSSIMVVGTLKPLWRRPVTLTNPISWQTWMGSTQKHNNYRIIKTLLSRSSLSWQSQLMGQETICILVLTPSDNL